MRFINLSVISAYVWNNAASKPHNFASKKSQLDTVTFSKQKMYKQVFLMKKRKNHYDRQHMSLPESCSSFQTVCLYHFSAQFLFKAFLLLLLCPISVSYCITSFYKGVVCRYFPGKKRDRKTSELTKMTVCTEQQSLHIKGSAADHHSIHILWFWSGRSVQDLLDEFLQRSVFFCGGSIYLFIL